MDVKNLWSKEVSVESHTILFWGSQTEASKVVIHFDMDILDSQDIFADVATVPDGMKLDKVFRVINDINAEYDIVGLGVTEPMPHVAIKLKNMLNQLPLLN